MLCFNRLHAWNSPDCKTFFLFFICIIPCLPFSFYRCKYLRASVEEKKAIVSFRTYLDVILNTYVAYLINTCSQQKRAQNTVNIRVKPVCYLGLVIAFSECSTDDNEKIYEYELKLILKKGPSSYKTSYKS